MKVFGTGNEVSVEFEPGEIPLLLLRELSGTARIYGYDGIRHNIPFKVQSSYSAPDIEVSSNPMNSYLPEAESISVMVGIEEYSHLINRGFCGTRFGGGGKITLRDKTVELF